MVPQIEHPCKILEDNIFLVLIKQFNLFTESIIFITFTVQISFFFPHLSFLLSVESTIYLLSSTLELSAGTNDN